MVGVACLVRDEETRTYGHGEVSLVCGQRLDQAARYVSVFEKGRKAQEPLIKGHTIRK